MCCASLFCPFSCTVLVRTCTVSKRILYMPIAWHRRNRTTSRDAPSRTNCRITVYPILDDTSLVIEMVRATISQGGDITEGKQCCSPSNIFCFLAELRRVCQDYLQLWNRYFLICAKNWYDIKAGLPLRHVEGSACICDIMAVTVARCPCNAWP